MKDVIKLCHTKTFKIIVKNAYWFILPALMNNVINKCLEKTSMNISYNVNLGK